MADGRSENTAPPANLLACVDLFMRATPGNFYDAMQLAEAEIGRKVSSLVSDVLLWFTADMAEEMRVPWVAVRTGGLSFLSVYIYRDAIQKAVEVAGKRNSPSPTFSHRDQFLW